MVDWGEGWIVYRDSHPRARKEHTCCECDRMIAVGETYFRATGLGYDADGHWETFTMCAHCEWAAKWLLDQCNGYLFHGVQEDLEEHWHEEPLLRSLDLGRRIILMRRRWRDRRGNLIPVPA